MLWFTNFDVSFFVILIKVIIFVRILYVFCAYFVRICAYVCVSVRTHSVRAYARMRTHAYAYVCVRMRTHAYAHIRTNTHGYAYTRTKYAQNTQRVRTNMRACARLCAHSCTCTCAHAYACGTFGLSRKGGTILKTVFI